LDASETLEADVYVRLSTLRAGDFMDQSYVNMDVLVDRVTYTVRVSRKTQVDDVETEKELDCSGFSPIYAPSPFGTRTLESTLRYNDWRQSFDGVQGPTLPT
jgi:hypothetical protein